MKRRLFDFAVVFLFFPSLGLATHELVRTQAGWIRGTQERGVWQFKGIPYAAPPLKRRRWLAPVSALPWTGIRDASGFGPGCPQAIFLNPPQVSGQEDCLYLNVWTPALEQNSLPVLVWIHGGAFLGGMTSEQLYEASALASKGAVVVSIDYRLGGLGFLGHPLLSKESSNKVSGNYGLLDQIAALEWIKRNIAAFGGDPRRITVFGQSAGGESIVDLMVSPLASGLFHRAIIESGCSTEPYRDISQNTADIESLESIGKKVSHQLGCDISGSEIDCLREKTASEIVTATLPSWVGGPPGMIQLGPVIDRWVLPEDPGRAFRSGQVRPVPVIVGMNSEENTMPGAMWPVLNQVRTVEGYKKYLEERYSIHWKQVWNAFPVDSDSAVRDGLLNLSRADQFRCDRSMAQDLDAVGAPSYLFLFSRVPPFAQKAGAGAFHTLELYYVFGNLLTQPDFDPIDRMLSEEIQSYWVRFATSGSPNDRRVGATWPEFFEMNQEATLELGNRIIVRNHLYSNESELLNRIDPQTLR